MCYALPAPRCSNHATIAREKAEKEHKENPTVETLENLKKAMADYYLTPKGIQELRSEGKDEDAERVERMRASLLKFFNESRGKGREKTGSKTVTGSLKEKMAMASNADTDNQTMMMLAKDKNPKIRVAVAQHSKNAETLEVLAKDEDEKVVQAVAKNEFTEPEILTSVYNSTDNQSIHGKIAQHPYCPRVIYPYLARSLNPSTRESIAKKNDVNVAELALLSEDRFPRTRRHVAENPRSPKSILATLAQDDDGYVSTPAKERLNPQI